MNNKKLIEWLKEYYATFPNSSSTRITDDDLRARIGDEEELQEETVCDTFEPTTTVVVEVGDKYVGYDRCYNNDIPIDIDSLEEYKEKRTPTYVVK